MQQLCDELTQGEVTFFEEVQLLFYNPTTNEAQVKLHHAPPDLCLGLFCIFNHFDTNTVRGFLVK